MGGLLNFAHKNFNFFQMHDRGLKMGIYANYGKFTCMGYPGSIDTMEEDAKTFAEWGADMLKFDGCFTDPSTMDEGT